ncbi:PLDc N-terminal domain-containing protein [Zunongwangia sp.]|uniref:PLDc N-terminal domain-containing protein n=1 Tax=Zunongwangia sp. TaxID=1965325 RepID=UPI003AA801D6
MNQELQFFLIQSLGLLAIIFPVFCVLSILKNSNSFSKNSKWIWTSIVILLPIIGSLLYLSIGRENVLRARIQSDF